MDREFAHLMKETLLSIPSARVVAGGREILLRCRSCSDSSDPTHAHMYIKIPMDNEPFLFNCVKCQFRGIVTTDKMLEWGLYQNTDMLVELSKYNKHILNLPKNRKYNNNIAYRLNNTFVKESRLSE